LNSMPGVSAFIWYDWMIDEHFALHARSFVNFALHARSLFERNLHSHARSLFELYSRAHICLYVIRTTILELKNSNTTAVSCSDYIQGMGGKGF
jgi:hypothetical protein